MKWTRSQVSNSGELDLLSGRISPSRNEPKKAMQQAAHTTILLSLAQLLSAISWPKIFRRGKVITNFAVFKMFVYRFKFLAPLIIELIKKIVFKIAWAASELVCQFQIRQIHCNGIWTHVAIVQSQSYIATNYFKLQRPGKRQIFSTLEFVKTVHGSCMTVPGGGGE
jgi:hypothetical protein